MSPASSSLFLLSLYLHRGTGNGAVTIGLSANPAYEKEAVTLTCAVPDVSAVVNVMLRAFNGGAVVGLIRCGSEGISNDGLLSRPVTSFCNSTTLNLSAVLNASISFAVDYMCTVAVINENSANSTMVHLQIYVAPSAPQLFPTILVFNDGDSFTVSCISSGGSPAANLSLTIHQDSPLSTLIAQNVTSVTVNGAASRNWQNASVTCRVLNHNLPYMTTTAVLQVNYIYLRRSPQPISSASNNVTLSCSDFVESFPQPKYSWSTPVIPDANGSRSPLVVVPQGQEGVFNCTVSNTATGRNVTVVFAVISSVIVSTSVGTPTPNDSTGIIIGIAVPVAVVVIAALVVLVILYRRGHFVKRKPSGDLALADPSSADVSRTSEGDCQMCDNDLYETAGPRGLSAEVGDHTYNNGPLLTTASETLGCNNHSGDPDGHTYDNGQLLPARGSNRAGSRADQSGKAAKSQAGFKQPEDGLLVAASGLVANLKHKVLRRTCLVEFSEQSSSLRAILDAIRRAVPAQQQFTHVALLLRPTDEGLLLSRPDGQLINSSTVSGSKPLRSFLLSLCKQFLKRSSSDARFDLLNDAGAGSNHVRTELVQALMDLLKVPASVAGDMYGISTTIDHSSLTVADLYFDRQRIDDIVYAEIVIPKEHRPPVTVAHGDDRVVYSEIRPLKKPPV